MTVTIPSEASQALQLLQRSLLNNLHSVYLHGSAVTQGLRPRSDVDVLAFVHQPLSTETRQQLAHELLPISGHYPTDKAGRRPLEVMIFVADDPSVTRYPARCEFIYGEWLRADIENGDLEEASADPEYTLILAQAERAVLPLYTATNDPKLPTIPASDIQQAISDLLPALVASAEDDERNVLLTLARMWYTASTGEFTSKDHAATWAAERVEAEHAELLRYARDGHVNRMDEDWAVKSELLRHTMSIMEKHIQQLLQNA